MAVILVNRRIDIAPNDSHYVVKASLEIPRDVELSGIAPHAHYLCKDMKITAHIWTKSARNWAHMDPASAQHPGQPDAPQQK